MCIVRLWTVSFRVIAGAMADAVIAGRQGEVVAEAAEEATEETAEFAE